jgi:DNA-directed RNA polymerase subunit RPC12/RpoP
VPDIAESLLPIVDASCDCPKCVGRTTATYDVSGYCSNCGARFIVRNRKGDTKPLAVDCPACEVYVFGWHR